MRSSLVLLALSSSLASCRPQADVVLHVDSSGPIRGWLSDSEDPGLRLDPHRDGKAGEVRVTGLWWGRLADVYALGADTGERIQLARDLVVGPDILSDGRDYEVDTHPITSITSVTILHRPGTNAF